MSRASRGASYMDQYDSQYDNGGKYDVDDEEELSTAARYVLSLQNVYIVSKKQFNVNP